MEPCLNSEEAHHNGLDTFLENLRNAAGPLHPEILADLLSKSNITHTDIAQWAAFDSSIYTRSRVALFSQVEVLVMCWRSGQLNPIHDHKGSACAIKVIGGIATEISYKQSNSGTLVPVAHAEFSEGEVFHSFDTDIHQMGNLEGLESDLITLHCYSPPLVEMKLFDEKAAFFHGYDSLLKKVSHRLKPASLRGAVMENSSLSS